MNEEMTAEQAIGLLDSAVSQMSLNRAAHNQLTQALNVLIKLTVPEKEEEEK